MSHRLPSPHARTPCLAPHRVRTAAVLLGLCACAMMIGGCQIIGYIAGIGGERHRAEYELADRPTLVMVEDPGDALPTPELIGVLAGSIENHLEANQVFDRGGLIPQAKLREVADELGDDYAQAPIDRIGRLVDAEQVIHVMVRSVNMVRAVGVYEPVMELEVKVIDAVDPRRLFPEAEGYEGNAGPAPGRRVSSEISRSMSDRTDQGLQATLARQLAEHAGRDVARLFYEWHREYGTNDGPRR